MMPNERRLSIRKTPEHLSYLSLRSGNGGIVLDVSEGGLRFQAIAPVEADGPIHFRFAIDSATRIKAIGELAWKDETGKIGGLRFIQLPDETREQIRVWAGQSKKSSDVLQGDIPVDISVAGPASEPAIEAQAGHSGKSDLATVTESMHPLLYSLRPPIYSAPFYELSMFPLALNHDAGTAFVALTPPFPMHDEPRENTLVPGEDSTVHGVCTLVAEPVIEPEATPESETEWESLASTRNPLPYKFKAPFQSTVSSEISMSTRELESEAAATDVALRQPVASRHPLAAVGLTVALALVVSVGICAYISTSKVGELLMNWGVRLVGGPAPQTILRYPAPAANSVSHSVRIVRR